VQAEQNPSTAVMWGMNQELADSVNTIADKKKRPVDEVFNRFLEWKLGRPMNATRFDPSEKKKSGE
jgi:hypothetical protein